MLTKEEIIDRVQEKSLKKLGPRYIKEDFAPVGASSEAYSPSFGAWSKYDSDIHYKTSELERDMIAGRKEATKNDMKEIRKKEKR